ncbi:hypothetical protein L210DRAFT_3611036 [Boletus edulis BED1]|uniref:RPA43 OB domain-containing protein n=1 Tax=Boletus edulis BED1 TaxID=1328754 RepID=A0AAD4GHV0_BOLED|nr:hypothetical protein L210DRAFT_3611036 [Boletus edulis BED1]
MTSTLSDPPSKKRRHRGTEGSDASPKKKVKRHQTTAQSVASPSEDALSSQKHKPKSPKDKGKSRAPDPPSEFRLVSASLVLSIPPVFASDLRAGVEEMLDSMVMRYIPSLQGVLLAHSDVRFLSKTASILGDCPFAVCNVSFDATVWGPQVSMKLVGRINLCSPDHISLLVHRTFNVSIPRHHIPQDQWTFEYGPAENDPEFGDGRNWDTDGGPKDAADREGDVDVNDSTGRMTSGEDQEAESSGRWVHHLTGSRLGDPDGYVEFTVIGLTVANEMLSLQGSIQPDPFSPEHVPHPDKVPSTPPLRQDDTPEVEAQDGGGRSGEEEDEESDEDGFKHLARLTDEAQATQKAERAKEEAKRLEKAKKRKRRESHGGVGEGSKRAERKRIKE